MRLIFMLSLLISSHGFGQWKSFVIGAQGDTLNCVDSKGLKQGKWVIRISELRGEPGYEEEGLYVKDRREGPWRRYTLMGDLVGLNNYKWGYKDGQSMYFNGLGELLREENWKALNPDKLYDTLVIEDVDKPDTYRKVVVKNEGVGIRHGHWTYYDPVTKFITKEEEYFLGALEGKKKNASIAGSATTEKKVAKPKEVLEFEKQNAGKKKIKVRDGSTGL